MLFCNKSNQAKNLLLFALISMAIAITLGAFAAHYLRGHLPLKALMVFRTGVHYQIIHSLALILLVSLWDKLKNKKSENYLKASAILFKTGIFLFSGSLYLLATNGFLWTGSKAIVGPLTPIGGLLFIAAWISFAIAASKSK